MTKKVAVKITDQMKDTFEKIGDNLNYSETSLKEKGHKIVRL